MARGRNTLNQQAKYDHRRALVAAYNLQGHNQKAIAKLLADEHGIKATNVVVANDLKKLLEVWRASALAATNEHAHRFYERLEVVVNEAFKGWRRSCEDKEKRTAMQGTYAGQERNKTSVHVEGQAGDPAFLEVVRKATEDQRKLLGVDAPERHEVSGAGGGPIGVVNVIVRTREDVIEFGRLRGQMQLAAQAGAGKTQGQVGLPANGSGGGGNGDSGVTPGGPGLVIDMDGNGNGNPR
jgi:hypothetical protein